MIKIDKVYSLIKNLLQSMEKEMAEIDDEKNPKINIKDKILVKKNIAQTLSKIVSVISELEKIDDYSMSDEISENDMKIIDNFYENFYKKNKNQ